MKTENIIASTLVLGALSMTSLTTLASQDTKQSPYYAGLQLGVGIVDIKDENTITSTLSSLTGSSTSYSSSTKGFAGRIYGGVMFNDTISAEIGIAKYNNADSSARSTQLGTTIASSSTNKTTAVDVLGVYSIPVTPEVKVHLKAGFAYVMNKYEVSAMVNGQDAGISNSQSTSRVQPKLAVGADYDLTGVIDNMSVGISYEFTKGSGRPLKSSADGGVVVVNGNRKYTPKLQMVALDVKYTF